jgi:hypothetical protein
MFHDPRTPRLLPCRPHDDGGDGADDAEAWAAGREFTALARGCVGLAEHGPSVTHRYF